jgi:hypothetical protein
MAADATTDTADDVAIATTTRQRQNAQLRPFRKGDPRASEAARKSAESRRATKQARRGDVRQAARLLESLADTHSREDLGRHAAAVAGYVLGQIAGGRVPIRNADDAATLLRALVDVARIEEGQPTSTALVAHVGTGATAEVLALRDQARRALGVGTDVAVTGASLEHVSGAATAAPDMPGDDT